MKNLLTIFALTLALFTTQNVIAQQSKPNQKAKIREYKEPKGSETTFNIEKETNKKFDFLNKKLTLTTEQQNKIKSILHGSLTQEGSLLQKLSTNDPVVVINQIESLRDQTKSQITSLLSADQLEKFNKIEADRLALRKGTKKGK